MNNLLTSGKELKKAYSVKIADTIGLRLTQLNAADNLGQIPHHLPWGLHKLKNNRKDQYAVWVKEKYRIVFYPLDDNLEIIRDPEFPKEKIRSINILEVVNYHV